MQKKKQPAKKHSQKSKKKRDEWWLLREENLEILKKTSPHHILKEGIIETLAGIHLFTSYLFLIRQ